MLQIVRKVKIVGTSSYLPTTVYTNEYLETIAHTNAKWIEVINANLIGALFALKHILPLMGQKKYGRIILFSSVVPQIGVIGTSAYSASKAGLWGLTKTVAIENAICGITINTINLGYFDIGMIKDIPTELLNKIINSIPMGRLGDFFNILKTVEYLIANDYITGSQINLNGGIY